MSIKYQNLHSFNKGLILLFQGILEARMMAHLHGSAHFTFPLRTWVIINAMFNYHLVSLFPDLEFQIFFEKEGATETGCRHC